MLPVTNF